GTERTIVVCGNDELDEVSLWGTTAWFDVTLAGMTTGTWTPADFGLDGCQVTALQVASPQESADRILNVFEGRTGPDRDIVVANAAVALLAAGRAEALRDAVGQASAAIDEGRAAAVVVRLAEWTSAPVP